MLHDTAFTLIEPYYYTIQSQNFDCDDDHLHQSWSSDRVHARSYHAQIKLNFVQYVNTSILLLVSHVHVFGAVDCELRVHTLF